MLVSRRTFDVTLSTRYGPLDIRTFHIDPEESDDDRVLTRKVRAWLQSSSLDAGDTITIEKARDDYRGPSPSPTVRAAAPGPLSLIRASSLARNSPFVPLCPF